MPEKPLFYAEFSDENNLDTKRVNNSDFNLSAFSYKLKLIYFLGFLYVFINATKIVPIAAKINLVVNGDIDETSSTGSFTSFTVTLIGGLTQFFFTKYTSAFSDYVGRKPLIILGAAALGISAFIYAISDDVYSIYLGAFINGTFQYFTIIIGKIIKTIH